MGSQLTGGAGADGLISMVMGMMYPTLKPMYEASIPEDQRDGALEGGPQRARAAARAVRDQSAAAASRRTRSRRTAAPSTSAVPAARAAAAAPAARTSGSHGHESRLRRRYPMSARRTRARARARHDALEIMVAMGVMAMIRSSSTGRSTPMSRGRRGEALRADRRARGATRSSASRTSSRARSCRCIGRRRRGAHLARPLSSRSRGPTSIASTFASFAHRRVKAEAHGVGPGRDWLLRRQGPDKDDKMDLVRREESPIDVSGILDPSAAA